MRRAVDSSVTALLVSIVAAALLAASPSKAAAPRHLSRGLGDRGAATLQGATQPTAADATDLLPLSSACGGAAPPAAPLAEHPVPFAPGEVLEYDITRVPYLVSGTARATVLEKRPGCSSLVYRIVAEGQPVPLLARLYRLTYRVATVLDAVNLLPYAGAVYSEEGARRRMKLTRFDPRARTVRFEMDSPTGMRKDLPPRTGAHDPLSLLYALRSLPLYAGQQMVVPVTESGRWYTVTLRTEARDRIETGLGELIAWRLAGEVHDEAGRRPLRGLTVWFSDDARRWPVKLTAVLRFGPLTFTLRTARPP
jgi:hypothetical protein